MRSQELKYLTLFSSALLALSILACSSTEKTLREIEDTAEARSLNWKPESQLVALDNQNKLTDSNINSTSESSSTLVSGNIAGGFSINDMEKIGYKKNEEVNKADPSRYRYDGLLEAWDGEIVVNDQTHFLEILIFDRKFDDIEGGVMMISLKGRLRRAGVTLPVKTGYIKNILVACYAEEACSYIIENLQ